MLETKSRILVVDDYPALVTIMHHKLIQKGYEVITAQNGQDALEQAKTQYPDLIISDVEMPIMDGYELCKSVKNDPKLRNIPIILVTSRIQTESLLKGIEAGADNYLTKPYDDDTLFAKVQELLHSPIVSSDITEIANVKIDGHSYNIKADYTYLVNLLVSTYKNILAQNLRFEKVQQGLNSTNQELELTKEEHEELLQNVFPKKVAAGGLPERNNIHPIDVCLAALNMMTFVNNYGRAQTDDVPYLPLKVGIYTEDCVVGVIGKKRFAYDIWGAAVNLAAHMEQNAENSFINISQDTFERVKNFFICEPKGEIEAKNIGEVPTYFQERIKPELSDEEDGFIPNRLFIREYNLIAKSFSPDISNFR